ncbi:hypothetical protein GCM10010420_08890 [Streptomyces glaucosporus]|uniref:Secreted protein n=1 Tax=Streptomyces glaucosporus TaxID=284044 RepID=A0ABN3HTU9_9ACTN
MILPRAPRRAAASLLAVLPAAALVVAGAAPAHAEGYRYWSFWERDGGTWTYATQGPGTLRPGDGDVLGFRFAVSEDSADAERPRGSADFEEICGGTEPRGDGKRIALNVDFGTPADAPSGERPPKGRTVCAVVPEDGTAADALAAALKPLRYDSSSLLCAIAGYPRTGCGEQVSGTDTDNTTGNTGNTADGTDKAGGAADGRKDAGDGTAGASEDTGGGSPASAIVGAAVVAVLFAAAVLRARRRRS